MQSSYYSQKCAIIICLLSFNCIIGQSINSIEKEAIKYSIENNALSIIMHCPKTLKNSQETMMKNFLKRSISESAWGIDTEVYFSYKEKNVKKLLYTVYSNGNKVLDRASKSKFQSELPNILGSHKKKKRKRKYNIDDF